MRDRLPSAQQSDRFFNMIQKTSETRRLVAVDIHMPGDVTAPRVFVLTDSGIADPDDAICGLWMNAPCKHFPGAANAILLISVQDPQIRVRIRCQNRLAIAEQPRFDFFDTDPDHVWYRERKSTQDGSNLPFYLLRRDIVGIHHNNQKILCRI